MDARTAGETTLPRGRHGLPSDFVAGNQRRRLIGSMAASCAERGYAKTSVSSVIEGAHVSRKTFYEQFSDKQECALAAFETLSGELVREVERACITRAAWTGRVCAGIGAAVEHLAADPDAAHFLTVGVVGVGPKGIAAQHAAFERLSRGLVAGRTGNPRAEWMPPEAEWGLVAYMTMLVSRRLTTEGAERLAELEPELIEAALTPYLGIEEAREAAGRPPLGSEDDGAGAVE